MYVGKITVTHFDQFCHPLIFRDGCNYLVASMRGLGIGEIEDRFHVQQLETCTPE
jgi:hypothetical protein